MLAKCANPVCSNTFRYLHEGKLYVIQSAAGVAVRNLAGAPSAAESPAIEYAWLCSSCCRDMTIHVDRSYEVRVVQVSNESGCRRA